MSLRPAILNELVCPACNGPLSLRQGASGDVLSCTACGKQFPVSPSLVSFTSDLREQTATASTFGFEWKAFWKGFFDKGDVFGLNFDDTARYFLSSTGLNREDLPGLKILDAGTGSGRIPMSLRGSNSQVYAVDIHDGLHLVADRFKESNGACFFRADLFSLPFKDGFFDVAWSSGVIHHTPNPARAFASIARKVKPGGRIFVSVYGKDLHHYRLFRKLLPFTRHMPVYITYLISALLAIPLYVAFNGALLMIRIKNRNQEPPYRFLGFTVESIGYKTYRSILLNLFDQLHPRYQSEHSVDEVQHWFTSNNLGQTIVVESVGMVGIRGIKK